MKQKIQYILTKKDIKDIRKYIDYQDWFEISIEDKLSESFIREFQDEVYWYYISQYQKLSEKFIFEFIDKIYVDHIIKHQKHLSIETINQLKLIRELKK